MVILGRKEIQEHKDPLDRKDLLGIAAPLDPLVRRVDRVEREELVCQEERDLQERRGPQEVQDRRAHKVHRVLRVLPGHQGQPETKVHPVLLDHLVHQVSLVSLVLPGQ